MTMAISQLCLVEFGNYEYCVIQLKSKWKDWYGWVWLGRVWGDEGWLGGERGRRPSRTGITCIFPQLFYAINRLL